MAAIPKFSSEDLVAVQFYTKNFDLILVASGCANDVVKATWLNQMGYTLKKQNPNWIANRLYSLCILLSIFIIYIKLCVELGESQLTTKYVEVAVEVGEYS